MIATLVGRDGVVVEGRHTVNTLHDVDIDVACDVDETTCSSIPRAAQKTLRSLAAYDSTVGAIGLGRYASTI